MSDAQLRTRLPGRRYLLVVAVLPALFTMAFLAAAALRLPFLVNPGPLLRGAGMAAALIGVGLLLIDVVLPVPSSLVMITNGALFGVGAGALLSLLGGLGATLLAFLAGRRARVLMRQVVPPEQEQRANDLLDRYGTLAILITRPVPILAETVAVLAGTSRLSWQSAVLAGLAGTSGPAVVYAIAGAVAATAASSTIVFGGVLGTAVVLLIVGRSVRTRRRSSNS